MKILRTREALCQETFAWRRAGERIAVVPTMGALHAGHLSLVDAAKAAADRTIATIFVNPKQFNNPDDLALYPCTEADDLEKLAASGVDAVYIPDVGAIYPEGFVTTISVAGITEGLCGASRPTHFDGVATVVAKLLLQTRADIAVFGEKDFQQLEVVKRMVRDLDIPAEIIGRPTVRDADGLALSSRNARLSPEARAKAAALPRALRTTADRITGGAAPAEAIANARAALLAAGFSMIDYLDLRAEGSLAPLPVADRRARLFVAAWLDGVRLIDNLELGPITLR